MKLPRNPRWRAGAALAAVAGAFALSLVVPIPSLPDSGRAAVADVVESRLPGWTIKRVERTWEGAYTIVTACGPREMGFQYVPGHGLPAEDAWLSPNDGYSRDRLRDVSDHWRYLIWYQNPAVANTLSCHGEVAGSEGTSVASRRHD